MTLRLRFFRVLPLAALAAVPLAGSAACGGGVATILSSEPGPDGGAGGAACSAAQDCNADLTISSLRGQCVSGKCVCNPGVRATANGKCGDIVTDAGPSTGDCVAKGGVCINEEIPPPPNGRRAGPGEGTCASAVETCWVSISPVPPGPACTTNSGCNDDPKISSELGTCTLGICVCRQGMYVQPSGKCGPQAPPDCPTQAGTCRQMPATCLGGELGGDQSTNMSCGDFVEAACCLKASACKAPVDFQCCSITAGGPSAPTPICVNGWKTCVSQAQVPTALPGTCK